MSKKRDSLANDSLEFLLVVMTNTFGSVMFIAIVLVIISSFTAVSPIPSKDKMDLTKIDTVNLEIVQMEKEISVIQQQNSLKEKLIKSYGVIDTGKYIERLASLKDENTVVQNEIRQQENKIRMTATEIKVKQHEKEKFESKIKENIVNCSEQISLMNKQIEDIQKQIKKIQEDTLKTEERMVGFAKLSKTEKQPFVIYLEKNSIYRISDYEHLILYAGDERINASKDITYNFIAPNIALIKPITGLGIALKGDSKKDNSMLDLVFNQVNKDRRFVRITVNHDSFHALIPLLKYLRNNKFSFDWFLPERENTCVLRFAPTAEYRALN